MSVITINLTKAAIAYVKKFLQKNPPAVFRLAVKDAGCSGMKYVTDIVENPQKDDICLQAEEGFIYYVDKNSAAILNGATLDCIQEQIGMSKLIFTANPNVTQGCGCGESFSAKEKSG